MALSLKFWTRGDGTNAGRYGVYDFTHSANIIAATSTGVTGTSYTQVTANFAVPAGCYDIQIRFFSPVAVGGIAYFDDVELTGNMTLSGVYAPSGITYGQPGPIAGLTAVEGDGVNSHIYIGSKAFNSLMDGDVGSAIVWGKVKAAAQWTDATTHRYLFHNKSMPLNTLYIVMGKQTDLSDGLRWVRSDGTDAHTVSYSFTPSGTLDWFCMGMTCDVTSTPKRIACYLYILATKTFVVVSDSEPATGEAAWNKVTNPSDGAPCDFMAGTNLTTQEWIGYESVTALWNGVALSTAEMQGVMVV